MRFGFGRRVLFCGLLAAIASSARGAQPVAPPAAAVPPQTPTAPAAPDDGRKDFMRDCFHRATALAQASDFAGANKVLSEFAQKHGQEDPYYDELQGTLLAMQKDYPAAQQAFERELAKTPDSFVGRFNRAEMIMLQSHYAVAEREFGAIERLRSPQDPAVADLCRFKRVVCYLCEGDLSAAELLVPPVKEEFESPALYYARATLEFAKKNQETATKMLAEARSHFSLQVEGLYTDCLVEMRWGQREPDGQFAFKPRAQ